MTDKAMLISRVFTPFLCAGLGFCSLSVGLSKPAKACIGDPAANLAQYGNSCPEFDYTIDNTVILKYEDPKLNNSASPPRAGAQYFQFGVFNTASGGASIGNKVTLTNLGWSRSVDPASFTTFQPSFETGAGTASSAYYNYAPIVAVPGPPPPMGSPFYLRYTIPAGTTSLDDVLASTFLFNNNSSTVPAPPNTTVNGASGGQILEARALLSGGELTRDNVAAVPAPLPLLGVGTLAAGALRLRRRLRQQRQLPVV
ncbi:MAG: hypothetical protein ACKO2F_06590 [Cyanobacteriota bacterium]